VSLVAGGAEIICSVRSATREQRDELLLQRLPSTSAVLSLSAHATLHRFLGLRADDWTAHGTPLSRRQARELVGPRRPLGDAVPIDVDDQPLLDALARDGRTSYAALARVAGSTEARVTRRVGALHDSGVLYFDVDLAAELLGFTAPAHLWLTVAPADLARIGTAIADHPEVGHVAAVSGPANLWVAVICRDTDALYRYVTTRIGAIDGVRSLEISPMLRQVKYAGSILSGPRLADPLPSRS
jgi:DNA-binding Lrp family transcriptional regulator